MTGDLPKFRNPPVAEVVLGVQFPALPAFHVGHVGILWGLFQSRFPRLEQQAALPHSVERPGIKVRGDVPSLTFLSGNEFQRRVWFVNVEDTDLVQVQADRFIRNWRRYNDPSLPYPSYETLKPEFIAAFEKFSSFVRSQQLGEIDVDQCEVTYINHIEPCDVWREFGDVGRVFRGWSEAYPEVAGSPAESVSFKAAHQIFDAQHEFVGRIFVELDSVLAPPLGSPAEPRRLLQLQLSVRGRPLHSGFKGVTDFMDMAHVLIVNSFVRMTTPEMHSTWGRMK